MNQTATKARGKVSFPRKMGQLLMIILLVVLIAGQFDLGIAFPHVASLDIRLIALVLLVPCFALWISGARNHLSTSSPAASVLVFFLAWSIWLALSATWAPPEARVDKSLADLCFMIVFISLAAYVVTRIESEDFDIVWKFLVFVALVYFAAAMIAGPGDQGRYSAFGGGPNVFVRILVLGAISALVLYLKSGRVYFLGAVPILALGATLSGSRGGLVAAVAVVFTGALPFARRVGVRRFILISLAVGSVIQIMLMLSGPSIGSFIQSRFINQSFMNRYTSGRDVLAEQAFEIFRLNWGTGAGLDGFYGLLGFSYPHNLFLQTAAEGGIVGIALLISGPIALTIAILRSRERSRNALSTYVAGMYIMFASLFSGGYYDSRLMWFFFVVSSIELARPWTSRGLVHDKFGLTGAKRSVR